MTNNKNERSKKILCIEDQREKYEAIEKLLLDLSIEPTRKDNYQDALIEMSCNRYPVVLLDMSMPICKRENVFESFAGKIILGEMKRKKYNMKVIMITGFSEFEKGTKVITLEELDKDLKERYGSFYIGYVKYDSTSIEWQRKLQEMIINEKEYNNEGIDCRG